MLKGFRDFILRGNVLDLAVGVIIGAAFGAVVTSLSKDVLTPLIGAIFGQPDFSAITLGPVLIGNLINAIIAFLITALALYFFVVMPVNRLTERFKSKEPEPQPTRTCPECLSDVPAAARRCAFCTTDLTPERVRAAGA
jgi:large conductance mechanosensitive channel